MFFLLLPAGFIFVVSLIMSFFRVLNCCHGGTSHNVIDPIPERKWIYKKANKLKLKIILPQKTNFKPISCPKEFTAGLQNLNSSDGSSKYIVNLPSLTLDKIVASVERVNKTFITKSKKIEKHFQQGQQFLEENFIDVNSILSKRNNKYFSVKGICSASLKQKDRWVFIAIQKSSGDIEFATCQCPAGRAGTCSHFYTVSKVIAKWVIDRVTIIPQQRTCTSKPYVWSVPQSRGRLEKHSVNELEIKSPPNKKSKVSESNSTQQGINSAYVADAHSRPDHENSKFQNYWIPQKGQTLHFISLK